MFTDTPCRDMFTNLPTMIAAVAAGLDPVRIVPEKRGRSNRHNIFLTAKGRTIAAEMLCPLRPPQTSEAA